MAAPANKNIQDLNGKWTMNKPLSGDTDAILLLQGVGWLTRKAIGLATITLVVKQYTDNDSRRHIDIEQLVSGGIKGTTELRTLIWTEAEHTDHVFGPVKGKSRMLKLSELSEEADDEDKQFLKSNWESADGEFVESLAWSEKSGWTAIQIWGFQMVEGVRKYVRNVVVKKGDEKKMAKLVYDWVGE